MINKLNLFQFLDSLFYSFIQIYLDIVCVCECAAFGVALLFIFFIGLPCYISSLCC